MACSPMQKVWESKWKMPHPIDRKKYGQPRFALYRATERHAQPGLYLWVGLSEKNGPLRRNYRIPFTGRVTDPMERGAQV